MAFAMAHLDELLEVARPQESDEVFHDAVDLIDNEESIWMDANEASPYWEIIDESTGVMESELGGVEQAINSAEIGATPDFTYNEHGHF